MNFNQMKLVYQWQQCSSVLLLLIIIIVTTICKIIL